MKILKIIVITLLPVFSSIAFAQELHANLQIRPRYEFRNGYKAQFLMEKRQLNLFHPELV